MLGLVVSILIGVMNHSENIQHAIMKAVQRYRFNRQNLSGRRILGQTLGKGSGDSVEFSSFRHYVPGDDLRRLDWAAVNRTGKLILRQYREEVSPHVDVFLDVSRSMSLDDGRKQALCRELAGFFHTSPRLEGCLVTLFGAGRTLSPLQDATMTAYDAQESVMFTQPTLLRSVVKPDSTRIVISDFLSTHDPHLAVQQLAAGSGGLLVVMILGPWEAEPPVGGFYTLQDSELGGNKMAVHLSERKRQRYLKRLQSIEDSVKKVCDSAGGVFIQVRADESLDAVLAKLFLPKQIVVAQ